MGCKVYGYVLMDNHYHIIVQTLEKKLQEIMHQINNKYSKYFNGKYKRVGHVYQGRYKAVMVQDERYMLKLLRYIHQNPVRAGLCNLVEDYKWSSDIYYRKNIRSFVNTRVIYEMLDKHTVSAMQKYKEYMDEPEDGNYSRVNAIGEEAYQVMCLSRKEENQRKRLDEILIETGVSTEDYRLIKAGSRKRKLTGYKIQFIQAAIKERYTYSEIGKSIGMTDSGVQHILDRWGSETITG
ncbi:transposase [Lutispora sp.]|uniref:transposase n=1 Tax=Lutispora sp. TaxID=2828727 RepID=UPI0035678A03